MGENLQEYIIALPILIFGGVMCWLIIFLETYRHFPDMHKSKRIKFAIKNASIMTGIFILILLVAFYFIAMRVIK